MDGWDPTRAEGVRVKDEIERALILPARGGISRGVIGVACAWRWACLAMVRTIGARWRQATQRQVAPDPGLEPAPRLHRIASETHDAADCLTSVEKGREGGREVCYVDARAGGTLTSLRSGRHVAGSGEMPQCRKLAG